MGNSKALQKPFIFLLLLCTLSLFLAINKTDSVFSEETTDTTIFQKEPEDPKRYAYQEDFVDPLGGFQYKYPLNLPPGTNGIAPSLTLVYNSNSGNGMLGVGWYLHGLAEIKRDFSYGVKYSDQDHFLYNGEKLIKGTDGYYRPQRETFERIRPIGLSSPNSYWEVTQKNGTKLYFGYQASEHAQDTFGRICAANEPSKIYLWSLSKVVDRHGNYYTVEYHQDLVKGDYYPIRITYTQNELKPLTAVRTVEFSYEIRSDRYAVFNPTKVEQDWRLKWITIKLGTHLLRKYRLDYRYGVSSLRSRLIGIQEYGNDGDLPKVPLVDSTYQGTGKKLPLTQFDWQQESTEYKFSQAFYRTDLPLDQVVYTPGDYNGDGKTDLIITSSVGSSWMLSGGTGNAYQTSAAYSRSEFSLGNAQFTPGDFNGDGKTDVIVTLSTGSYWFLSVENGSKFMPSQAYSRPDLSLGKVQFTPGDFNGDGKTDLMVTTTAGTYWYYSSGTGTVYQPYQVNYRPDLTLTKVQFTPGDFNGDGKTDIVYTTANGSYWHISIGTEDAYLAYESGSRSDLKLGSVEFTPGDYNGDGKTDLVITTGTGSFWYFSIANGGPNYQPYFRSDFKLGAIRFYIGEFNGDGRTDFLTIGSSGTIWQISGLKNGEYAILPYYLRSNLKPDTVQFTGGDLNGDGKTDLILTTDTNSLGYLTSTNNNLPADIITTVKTPQGGKISISYTPAADVAGAIISGSKSYPDVANSSATYLVTKLVFDDGLNHVITDNYTYANAMIHNGTASEQAGLGFAWIEKQNAYNGSTRTYYRQDDLDLRMLVDQAVVSGTDGQTYTETSYQYRKQPNVNYPEVKFIAPQTETVANYNGESGTPVQHRVEYNYDDYGNVKLQYDLGDIAVTSDEQKVALQYHYYIDSSTYLILPAVEQRYGIKLDGTEGLAAETRYYYNSAYDLERQELENGEHDVIIKYQSDSYGNQTAKTDGNGNTTTYTYDDQYQTFLRYQTTKFTEEIRYDELMRPVRKIDANGQVWQTTYDEFSRVKSELAPGDTVTAPTSRISYPDERVNSSGVPLFPNLTKTERKIADDNYLESYVYRDGFDRVVQEKTEAKAGWKTVDHQFDNGGREWRTSMPFYSSGSTYTAPSSTNSVKTYQFDTIGRLARETNPDGTERRTCYGKSETSSVDELGHVTTQRVIGNTEYLIKYTGSYPSQVEYAKTTKITACDGTKTIDATGQNEFVNMHDLLGRTISSTTPLNGTWNFGYDANGNLTTRTDAKKQTITFTYDELNRPNQRVYPNGKKVSYYYDEDGYGAAKGKLTRVTYPHGAESYTYDSRGRQTEIGQTIGGQTRTKRLSYNGLDQVATQTYPDGEVLSYGYDNGGYLIKLNGANVYVANLDYYATGKVSKLLYGNGVQTDFDYYDTSGEADSTSGTSCSFRLRQIRALNAKSGNDLFNLSYEYDKADNVKVKRDNLNAELTEQYGYDDLNRLTSATSTSYRSKAFRYDMLNNILEKDNRTYQYDPTHPYTLVSDGKFTYTYDANGNLTGRSDGRVLEWDFDNRLTSVSDGGTNYYDADGQRIAKDENGVITYYFFNDYEEEYQAGVKLKTVKYYFANNQRAAECSSVDGLRYYIQDHLGSTSVVTDVDGALVLRTNYAPYGETARSQGSSEVRYRYTGKEQDGIGLYYYGARFYDPAVGRFISVDPAKDGLNWYAYCNNNPINFIDPTGLSTITDESGKVTSVTDDGNLGIYVSSKTSMYTVRIGETKFWDSFISPDTHKPVGVVCFNKSIDRYMDNAVKKASTYGKDKTFWESRPNGEFDVKTQYPGHEGKSYHGFLFKGKYVTLRDAGNILAGMNAAQFDMSYDDFQKGSGALHAGGLTGVWLYNTFGVTHGKAPLWGEIPYQHSRSKYGYDLYKK